MLIRQAVLSLAWVSFVPTLVAAQIVFPELTGRVVDDADLLPTSTEAELSRTLRVHEQTTTNQVVVVTVTSLQSVSIERFGRDLGNFWGIGQADRDNGVLLLVAPNERKVRIEVGSGLEQTLTNNLAQRIIDREILPSFRNENYTEGIRRGTTAIIAVLEDRPWATRAPPYVSRKSKDDQISVGQFIFFFLLGSLLLILKRLGLAGDVEYDRSGNSFDSGYSGGGGSFGGGGASGSW